MLTLGLGGIYFFLVLDQADETVLGRRGLRIDSTPNHARVNVRAIERTAEQRTGVAVVAHIPVHRGTFEVLSTARTRADHVRATGVNDRRIK